jgi:hypothetical protein
MAITRKQLMAKARGFTISIAKMNEKDRIRRPSGEFGEDYNRLHAETLAFLPSISSLMPPTVRVYSQRETGSRLAESSYSELDAYCEQIFQLASECEDPTQ